VGISLIAERHLAPEKGFRLPIMNAFYAFSVNDAYKSARVKQGIKYME
jgi:hypothetical protein